MELPHHIRDLYRHWDRHVGDEQSTPSNSRFPRPASGSSSALKRGRATAVTTPIVREICDFAHERIEIWKKKISGATSPFTSDPILQKYRFCNVFREFDKQTIAIHTMLNPMRNDFALWLLNMFYCRMVARPETVESVGSLSFDPIENHNLYDRLIASPRPRYGTPYVFPVSTIMRSSTPNREKFICEYLPSIMQSIAGEIEQWDSMSVVDGVKRILPMFGFNLEFLWTEVLIDVVYQFPDRINLFDRFPIGPGSMPTMKMIDAKSEPIDVAMRLMSIPFDTGITINGAALRLSAENWEGIGCEFRKYTNLKSGHGRKRIYR